MEPIRNLVNGRWIPATGPDALDVTNPATGELLGRVPLSSAADVDAAVAAARAAFPAWRETPPAARARVLFRFKALLDAHRDEIAAVCTAEHGKTLAESSNEVGRGTENVEHACGAPTLMMGQALEDVAPGIDCQSIRQPLGVFAVIAPYNFPPMIPLWFYPYAIASGNTVVLKPSEQTPLSQQVIVRLAHEAGLPPGVLNLVNGARDVASALCGHPDVVGVSFVGSSAVARQVHRTCADHGKRCQALGGAKNFMIVTPSAVMDKSVANVAESIFGCAGQRCLAAAIVLAVGDACEPVRDRLLAAARAVVLGDGAKPGVTMGPVVSAAHRDRVFGYIAKGVAEGAKLLMDGREARVEGLPRGHWVGPTVFDDVRPGMVIATEEIFGPVACIMRADTLDSAIEIANRTEYGNASSIYTNDGREAREFTYRLQAGMLGINVGVPAPMAFFPFGGRKGSMFGDVKAHGASAVDFYTDRKSVITRWF